MKITFNIEAETPQDLLNAINKLAAGGIAVIATPEEIKPVQATPEEIAKPVEPEPEKTEPKRSRKAAAAQPIDKPESPVEPTPAPAEEAQSVATPETEPVKPAEPTFKIEDVRAKLADLSKTKQAAVKALISSYGVAKLTDIPAEKYAELMAKAEAL